MTKSHGSSNDRVLVFISTLYFPGPLSRALILLVLRQFLIACNRPKWSSSPIDYYVRPVISVAAHFSRLHNMSALVFVRGAAAGKLEYSQ